CKVLFEQRLSRRTLSQVALKLNGFIYDVNFATSRECFQGVGETWLYYNRCTVLCYDIFRALIGFCEPARRDRYANSLSQFAGFMLIKQHRDFPILWDRQACNLR